jgi:hypothetical protein
MELLCRGQERDASNQQFELMTRSTQVSFGLIVGQLAIRRM